MILLDAQAILVNLDLIRFQGLLLRSFSRYSWRIVVIHLLNKFYPQNSIPVLGGFITYPVYWHKPAVSFTICGNCPYTVGKLLSIQPIGCIYPMFEFICFFLFHNKELLVM